MSDIRQRVKRFLGERPPRQVVLAVVALTVILFALAFQNLVRPLYDEWQQAGAVLDLQSATLARLKGNLLVRREVDRQFRQIEIDAAPKSEEAVLSAFLRDVELLARKPNMVLVNMKPGPVESLPTHTTYPVKLTVSGALPDVLAFVSGLTNREDTTGLRSFTLRGTQGGNMVECTLSVWMVKLATPASATPTRGSDPEADEQGGGP